MSTNGRHPGFSSLATDQDGRAAGHDHIGWTHAGRHVPYARRWLPSDQHGPTAQGNGSAYVGYRNHRGSHHRADVHIPQTRCRLPADQHRRAADNNRATVGRWITHPSRRFAHFFPRLGSGLVDLDQPTFHLGHAAPIHRDLGPLELGTARPLGGQRGA